MKIWVDADACPRPVKETIFAASQRTGIPVVLVANRSLYTPKSNLVSIIVVKEGLDEADQYIVDHAERGDLVISADIPLAAQLAERGIPIIDPRGQLVTGENAQERLSIRNFMEDLRSSGYQGGGPAQYSAKDKQQFAATFDRILTKLINAEKNLKKAEKPHPP